MASLAERICFAVNVIAPGVKVDETVLWRGILADVRELEAAAKVARDALSGLYHGAGSGLSGEAMASCPHCQAHTKLTAALTKTGAIKGDV